jgi:RNA polymerase sigma factor (sigma-70 family)
MLSRRRGVLVMSDYRVKISVSNARIRRAMEAAGYKHILPMCRANGLSVSKTCDLINMKVSPINKDGTWRNSALDLADVLNVLPDDLFSDRQKTVRLRTNTGYKDVTESEVLKIAAEQNWNNRLEDMQDNAAIKLIASEQADVILNAAMEGVLTQREIHVLKAHFGIEGEEKTLTEIGEDMGVSIERIRQIEAKALRKLRLPRVSKYLENAKDVL